MYLNFLGLTVFLVVEQKNRRMKSEIEADLLENAKEADRRRTFIETNAKNLKHRLHASRRQADFENKVRLSENSSLMYECNDLRFQVKELERRLQIAEAQIESNAKPRNHELNAQSPKYSISRLRRTELTKVETRIYSSVDRLLDIKANQIRPPLNADDLMEDSGEGTYRQRVLPRVAKHDPRHRLSAEKNLNDKGIRKYQRELEALVVQLEEVHKEKDFYLSEMNKLRQQVALLSRPVEKANDRGLNYGFNDTARNGSFDLSPLRLSLDRSFSPYFEDRNNTEGERDMRVVGNIPTAKKYI